MNYTHDFPITEICLYNFKVNWTGIITNKKSETENTTHKV